MFPRLLLTLQSHQGGFRARKLNMRMLQQPVGIPQKKTAPTTKPKAFQLGQSAARKTVSQKHQSKQFSSSSPDLLEQDNISDRKSSSKPATSSGKGSKETKIHMQRGDRLVLEKTSTKPSVGWINYHESWAEKQEEGFTHWINYTLYPPELPWVNRQYLTHLLCLV